MRAPTVAGIGIILVAASALAVIAAAGRIGAAESVAPAADGSASSSAAVTMRASLTTNMRDTPERQSELVAVIPGGRVAAVTAQTPDGDWLRVTYPVGSRLEGWVPALSMEPLQGDARHLPVIDGAAPAPATGSATAEAETPPDLAISNAFVAPNGTLTIRIANVGRGRFDTTVGLRVTSAEGEVVGIVDIQRTLLTPGRGATVNTQVEIIRTGEYVLDLDWLNEVKESNEFNNALRTLLVAPAR